MKRLMRHRLMQAAFVRAMSFYLHLALRTTSWTVDGQENVAPHAAGQPVIVAFWHERLAVMPELRRRAFGLPGAKPAEIHALTSLHRDGRLIGEILQRFGFQVVHGSSSRGGPAALRRLSRLLPQGAHVAITPDGPRGPRRQAAPGLAQLAALSGAPILPCAAQTTRHVVTRSWDRMILPLPFGRGVIVCAPTIRVPRDNWQNHLAAIGEALTDAADRADRLCAA